VKSPFTGLGAVLLVLLAVALSWTTVPPGNAQAKAELSFAGDVFPIIKKNCLPCHAEDNFNPSGLVLDSFEKMMEGGEHGAPFVPGKATESMLVKKLLADPPFGDRMPMDKRKKKGEKSTKQLAEDEIKIISDWVEQGARNN